MNVLALRDLNRTTLHRQLLLERADAPVADVVGRVAGLQAQHTTWPYVALWTRRHTADVTELETAIGNRSIVKATVMRTTLHLVDAADARAFDVMSAQPRLATWQPSATRAGLDLLDLNAETREFCREPRTVAEMEAHLGDLHPGGDPAEHIPGGVRHAWFRLAAAGGGLVHAPPSGFWAEHSKSSYVDLDGWLGEAAAGPATTPTPGDALETGIERFLSAFGPATLGDFMQWSGQRRIGLVRAAVRAMGDRIVEHDGPDRETYLDLVDLDLSPADAPAPPRFLARWDSLLIAYASAGRARIVAPEHATAIYKKNGDVLPTFLVDGMVAGLWAAETVKGRATLHIEPFAAVPAQDRTALTDEAERLIVYLAPDAGSHQVTWAD
jgi:hypothetical protein